VKKSSWCFLATVLAVSCMSTHQARYSMLGESYPAKPPGFEVEVFQAEQPTRPFIPIARLDVHVEKSAFAGTSLEKVLPELKEQARLAGADAIIDIREIRSSYAETKIYHVTATGIRYTDQKQE
jgi:hypothetical protein